MYELIKATGNSYYIESPAKIGLIDSGDGMAYLIDSGSDKSAGKKAKQVIEGLGLTLGAIYNTHSHADHIGGNKFLKDWSGCNIYTSGIEVAYTRHTVLEPALLYGGNPIGELRHKFLIAEPSEALPLTDAVLPYDVEAIDLGGHTPDMVGFKTADEVIYLADCLSAKETLDKYGIGYIYDVGAYLDTLERVKTLEAKLFVPSHAEAVENITPLADYNIQRVKQTADLIVDICKEPRSFDTILKMLFDKGGLTMTAQQYALVGSTLRSYITYLKELGIMSFEINDNTMLWRSL